MKINKIMVLALFAMGIISSIPQESKALFGVRFGVGPAWDYDDGYYGGWYGRPWYRGGWNGYHRGWGRRW